MRFTRAELLSAPKSPWAERKGPFTSLAILATGEKHDSGYGLMHVVGLVGANPTALCTSSSDDIAWQFKDVFWDALRTDCILPSRALHFWSNHAVFFVGASLSSITICLERKNA